VYQHLVTLGLYRDLLASAVGTVVAAVIGHAVLWRPWRHHRRAQQAIEDKLDTRTPGGLADVVKAIREDKP
jgi:hypothetical protein